MSDKMITDDDEQLEKSANGSPAPTGRNMSDNFPASSITTTNVGNAKITSSVHGTGHIENKDVEFSNVKNVETSKMSKEEASKVVASPNNGPRVNSIVNKGLKYTSAQNNINSSNGQNSRIHNEGVNTAILVQTIENGTNSGVSAFAAPTDAFDDVFDKAIKDKILDNINKS